MRTKNDLGKAARDEKPCGLMLYKEEARMNDVKARYGFYPQSKWDANMELKAYFEKKAGRNIYDVVEKERFRP